LKRTVLKRSGFKKKVKRTTAAKRKPIKKASPRSKLIKDCDKLFSLYIRGRDKVCQRCGKKERLHCAHIFSRKNISVRYYPDNAICLCVGCHLYWAHREVMEFAEFIKKRLGQHRYEKLVLKKNVPEKVDLGFTKWWILMELEK